MALDAATAALAGTFAQAATSADQGSDDSLTSVQRAALLALWVAAARRAAPKIERAVNQRLAAAGVDSLSAGAIAQRYTSALHAVLGLAGDASVQSPPGSTVPAAPAEHIAEATNRARQVAVAEPQLAFIAGVKAHTAANGTGMCRTAHAEACERCKELADDYLAPVPDGAWESHPNCRCTFTPLEFASKTAAEPAKYAFGSTQLDLDGILADHIRDLAAVIPNDDLAPDGRETKPHLTVQYGLQQTGRDELDALREVCSQHPPVTITVGTTSAFPASETGSEYDVVKLDADGPGLHTLRDAIRRRIPVTDTHPTYQPHITLAYVKPGRSAAHIGNAALAGRQLTVRRLTVSDQAGDTTILPLGGRGSEKHMAEDGKGGYLVKDANGVEHLPTRKNGKPDHGLMGDAWAALTVGFRGKKYQGADKAAALTKLKALYKAEGLQTPDDKQASEGDPMDDESAAMAEPKAKTKKPAGRADDDPDGDGIPDDEDPADQGNDGVEEYSDPGVGDVHVPGTVNSQAKPRQKNHMLDRLTTRMQAAMQAKGYVTAEEYGAVLRHARGYAGGKGKAAARLAAEDLSANDTSSLLASALGDTRDCWIRDVFPEYFVYQDGPTGRLYKRTYTIGDAGAVTLGLPAEVTQKTTYEPAKQASEVRDEGVDNTTASAYSDDALTMCSECASGNQAGCTCPECSAGSPEDCRCVDAMAQSRQASDPLVSRKGARFRLFMPTRFAEEQAPEWIPFLPRPGTFKHPKYGEIAISKARNADFVKKFNSGVYQSQVPLDAEHETKLSGAVGWIKELRLNEDGSADARVEWTDRGRDLVGKRRYKFVSPEWYDEWEDPATEQTIKNVVIGGAITTRPFFKEDALRPLVATEHGMWAPEEQSADTPAQWGAEAMQFTELEQKLAATEAEAKSFREEAKANKEAAERAEALAKQASEQVAAMQAVERRRQFTEVASGFVGGATDERLAFMESLSDAQREVYVREQRALAEQLGEQSLLFREIGVSGAGISSDSAESKLSGIANRFREADPKLSYAKAYSRALTENPQLYQQSLREHAER